MRPANGVGRVSSITDNWAAMHLPENHSKSHFALVGAAAFFLSTVLVPSLTAQVHPRAMNNAALARRDPQIAKIVSEIDARNIERTIRKLVSFGTRNTLSEQNDPNRGIGAARDWL